MSTPLLRCGQLLRTRIAVASTQQTRHQSVFSDITSKLKQQVDSNPELKEQINKLKGTAEHLHQQAAAGAQQAQEVLRHVANQQTGGSGGAAGPNSQQQRQQQQGAMDSAGSPGPDGASAGGASAAGGGSDAGAAGQEDGTPGGGAATGGGAEAGADGAGSGDGAGDGAGQPGWMARGRSLLSTVYREVAEAISPSPETISATKRRAEGLQRQEPEGGGPAQLLVVEQPESAWKKRFRAFAGRYADSPMFRRLSSVSNTAAAKSRDAAEDLRERWETSNSPFVHRIQDMSDSVFTETEMAQSYREIAQRDPAFDMPAFLRQVKADVPVVVRAYLQGEIDILKEHCTPEMVERLTAIIRAQQAQGMFSDATLLDISEVELADIKFLEADPVVVVQFNCQQINCTRDKFGNVTEGAPDEVTRVFYFWALQQDAAGFVGTDGKVYPPRWQLREMLVQGMMQLVS